MSETIEYDYTRQDASGTSCVAHAWAKVPPKLSAAEREAAMARAAARKAEQAAAKADSAAPTAAPSDDAKRAAIEAAMARAAARRAEQAAKAATPPNSEPQ